MLIVQNPCRNCHGTRTIRVEVMRHDGKAGHSCKEYADIVCTSCKGKGFITQEDIDHYYRSWSTECGKGKCNCPNPRD